MKTSKNVLQIGTSKPRKQPKKTFASLVLRFVIFSFLYVVLLWLFYPSLSQVVEQLSVATGISQMAIWSFVYIAYNLSFLFALVNLLVKALATVFGDKK